MVDSRSSWPPVLIGAASGLRAQMGMAAVVFGVGRRGLPAVLRSQRVQRVVAGLALGELVFDQMPFVPARTEPPALVLRLATGALASGLLASSEGWTAIAPAAIGASAAGSAAFVGQAARRALARRRSPVAVALAEDLVAIGLAVTGVRLGRQRS